MMATIIIFLTFGAFVGAGSFFIARRMYKERVIEMCNYEVCCKVKELNCKIRKLKDENKVAIKYGCDALDERNEALIMLSKKLSDDIRNS